jgi:drug/metabolite transporter (DMT)-like permease
MKKLISLILSLIGMIIILYSVLFLSGAQQEMINLLGVLFALAGTIAALWSEELGSKDRWLMGANVVLFAVAVVVAIIKVALHAN